MRRIPACLRDRFTVAVEQLKTKAGKGDGSSRLGIAFDDLEMCRKGVIVHDVLKLGSVGDLLGRDGPIFCPLKACGNSFRDLANGIARTIVGDGSVDAVRSCARAKPGLGLVFGGCEAIDICRQCAYDLLRAVADDFKDDAFRWLF